MSRESELRPEWLRLALRLQGKARSQAGHALLTIRMIVGPDGNPIIWTEPCLTKIEPLSANEWASHILTLG